MEPSFFDKHPGMRDAANFVVFVGLVLIGTLILNAFVFRSFNVVGQSMEDTLKSGDRLIVNRIPVTIAQLKNQTYIPKRGEIIVFENPRFTVGGQDKYIVKRVVAFPGERVVTKDGSITVFNTEHPEGFDPDSLPGGGTPGSPTSGDSTVAVPDGELFVAGDHREGNYSCDSRGCLGTIPFYDVIGPVGMRIWPLNKLSTYPSS